MDEIYMELAVLLKEVESRAKSNAHRLDEHDEALKELREEQKSIAVIASSVDKIATSMLDMKEDIRDMKCGQAQLTEKVTILENMPAKEIKRHWDTAVEKLLWIFLGGIAVYLLSTALPGIIW